MANGTTRGTVRPHGHSGFLNSATTVVVLAVVILIPVLSGRVAAADTAHFNATVVDVEDGDTIVVLRDGRRQKIRLAGIDCPERGQPFFEKAKGFTAYKTMSETVTVDVKLRGRYRILVAEVRLPDGTSLNRELVTRGLAWWYRPFSNDTTLRELELEARLSKRGLWAASLDPIPPWEYWKTTKAPVKNSASLSNVK